VDSRRLEITCGEAPYLVSRYDVSTGKLIVPPIRRIGMLDRKLRIVNENTKAYDDWLKWTIRAFESCYGYEYQGDNVLIARINLLLSFVDYFEERWERKPDDKLLEQLANKIAWNIWQMDGLKDTVPLGKPYEEFKQLTLFDMIGFEDEEEEEDVPEAMPCRIFNWRSNTSLKFMDIKEMRAMGKKLFDYVIGNPPYQENRQGEGTTATPVYHHFMSAAHECADKVLLITPARFLFNAGYTPKSWNDERLNDPHFKVEAYYLNAADVFQNVDIKGGVTITYRDEDKNFGAIEVFTMYPLLNDIFHKVILGYGFNSFSNIVVTSFAYHYVEQMYAENPALVGRASKGHAYDLQSNTFDTYPEVYFDNVPSADMYIRILGRVGNRRGWKYIKRTYLNEVGNVDKYKVFLSKAAGTGQFGETLPEGIIGKPGDGATITFTSIGFFDTNIEAVNCEKYIKTKFARALLNVLKVTQDLTPGKWKYVPLQDFIASSDIDWSKSIHDIDIQLYRKYDLSVDEIEFIETHVKEMV
jgi:type II restriction enzyme